MLRPTLAPSPGRAGRGSIRFLSYTGSHRGALGAVTLGRATYQPGWRWSEHVGRKLGQNRCHIEHVGLVVAGCATAAFADGSVIEMRAGDLFYIPPETHDSWVVGSEPYVSLHFLGADHYAK